MLRVSPEYPLAWGKSLRFPGSFAVLEAEAQCVAAILMIAYNSMDYDSRRQQLAQI